MPNGIGPNCRPGKAEIREMVDKVRNDPGALRDFPYQNEDVCMAAVEVDGLALRYVKDQTPELCIAALRQNPAALQWVAEEYRAPGICLEAVRRSGAVVGCADEHTQGGALEDAGHDGSALEFVRGPAPEICKAAVADNGKAAAQADNAGWEAPNDQDYKPMGM